METIEAELAHDYGEQNEYMSLLGLCFDIQQNQYTYEFCPYKKGSQKEGSSSTGLGSWDGWEVVDDVRKMKFSGGQKCWNGPERSLFVEVLCGLENKVLKVDEPSTCVYAMKFTTPAACTTAHAQVLRMQLEAGEGDGEDDNEEE
jgi:protein kinase C substrate 80K-H